MQSYSQPPRQPGPGPATRPDACSAPAPRPAGWSARADDPGAIQDSYWDTRKSGHETGSYSQGRTTAQLQAPTGYGGIYGTWNVDVDGNGTSDSPWDFGMASQYPALAWDVDGNGQATWQEVGHQLPSGPILTATASPGQVALTWTPADASHGTPAPEVTYTVYRADVDAVEAVATSLDGLQYIDAGLTGGAYVYQVAAVARGGSAHAAVSRPPRHRSGLHRQCQRACGDCVRRAPVPRSSSHRGQASNRIASLTG